MSPYRTTGERDEHEHERELECPNGDLVLALGLCWIVSVARVACAVVRHETFGGEATMASLAVLLCPLLVKDALAWWLRRL
jgi:hypothetical protein